MTHETANHDPAQTLIREGWNHLMSQRPIAAWGSWQRAIRLNPDSTAARQAVETLQSTPELPLGAKKPYRFRKPGSEEGAETWDRYLRDHDLEELSAAAEAFERITDDDPGDAAAWFNRGLCLAWSGQDRAAIDCMDQVCALDADDDPRAAEEAWIIAEILRQGGGTESLSDDLRFATSYFWDEDDTPALLAAFPEIRQIPTPQDPTRPDAVHPELEVYEWLDRSFPSVDAVQSEADLPRVLATVYVMPGTLRMSSPRIEALETAEEKFLGLLGDEAKPLEQVAAPLPLPFLDADVWTARTPPGLDANLARSLTREVVEAYYENDWIHRPRQGLDGRSPLAAAESAKAGDAIARVKLEAVIQLREQLGARPSSLSLYQGYPFDRLRRRLRIEMHTPETIDRNDYGCMPRVELDEVNPADLDDSSLIEAYRSAEGLRSDALTSRFAKELVGRNPKALKRLDLKRLFAPLVREALARGNSSQALDWLDQAARLGDESTFRTWSAEIHSRTNHPDDAAALYQRIVDSAEASAAPRLALDAAETLLDNGHHEQAESFLDQVVERSRAVHDTRTEARAARLLRTLPQRHHNG